MGNRLIPKGENETEIIFVSQVDPKGSIPNMIKNSVAKGQTQKTHLIDKAFTKIFGY